MVRRPRLINLTLFLSFKAGFGGWEAFHEYMCVCVSSASFNSVCFYSCYFLPLEARLGFLWCLMLAFGKSQPWRALPCGVAFLSGCSGCPLMGGLSPSWKNLTFTMDCICWGKKKKGGFIHRAERTCWLKVFHWLDGFFQGSVYIL